MVRFSRTENPAMAACAIRSAGRDRALRSSPGLADSSSAGYRPRRPCRPCDRRYRTAGWQRSSTPDPRSPATPTISPACASRSKRRTDSPATSRARSRTGESGDEDESLRVKTFMSSLPAMRATSSSSERLLTWRSATRWPSRKTYDTVGEPEHLVEAMGDVQHSRAFGRKQADRRRSRSASRPCSAAVGSSSTRTWVG